MGEQRFVVNVATIYKLASLLRAFSFLLPVPLPPQGPSPAAELPPCPGQSGHGPSGWAVCQAPWWVLSKQQGGVSGPLCCPQGWAGRDGVGWAFAMLCSSLPTPRWHHHCGGMPGPRQWRSLGGRGALLAFGWDLCSLFAPGTPHSRCSAAPQPRAGRALAPLPRAIPSACAWGPRPGRAPPSRCPPVQPSPWQGRCRLAEAQAGQGAVHTLSVSWGPAIVFYRSLFLTQKQ